MKIILIRHGETALNAARVLQPPDTPLSERGRRQADAVAIRLAAMKIDGVVSSDLARAVETSQAIAAASRLTVRRSALLQERNFGDLRGCAYDGLGFDPIAMEGAPPAPSGVAHTAVTQRVAKSRHQAQAGGRTLPTSAAPSCSRPCPDPRSKASLRRCCMGGDNAGASTSGTNKRWPCGVSKSARRSISVLDMRGILLPRPLLKVCWVNLLLESIADFACKRVRACPNGAPGATSRLILSERKFGFLRPPRRTRT